MLAAAIILLTTAFAVFCMRPKTTETKEIPAVKKSSWSVLIYLCGSNLESEMGMAGKNLDEILSADIPEDVNVIIQTGGAKKWRLHNISADNISRYIVEDKKLTLLESLPQSDMGDEKTFSDFLSYGVANYPSEKTAVIIWDHGSGSINGVANDENYNFDSLTLTELEKSLNTVSDSMEGKFELFGFDACLMANYETAAILEPYAKYMLASEEFEPSGGWDYVSLFNTLSEDISISGDELGKAVCDSYLKKCELNGKDSTATLSTTDLSKFGDLSKAFNAMAQQMKTDGFEAKGIQTYALSAKNSQKFGGTNSSEGFSNLIDLRNFAENSKGIESAEELIKAVDNAVIYNVYGAQKSNSGGLSFFYPSKVEQEQIDSYCADISPSEEYSDFLNQVYGNIPQEPITFTDYGSKAEDNTFQVAVDKNSMNYILSVDYILVEYSKTTDNNAIHIDAAWLGQDNDLFSDNNGLTFHSNFRGVWLTLNGIELFVTPVESTKEYIIFTAPIMLNSKRTNLRFAFIWDDTNENGGYYQIIGTWNGLDKITGMSDKEITKLKSTDEIQTVYYNQSATIYNDGSESGSESLEEKFLPVPKGDYKITEEPLKETDYAYQFVITDIFGGKHYSYLAHMEMTKTPDEISAGELDDNEYAAVPTNINESAAPFIVD